MSNYNLSEKKGSLQINSNKASTNDAKKLSLIHRSTIRLYNLINQILEFRKNETQNRTLLLKYGDISTLINEIGIKYREFNQNNNLDIMVVDNSHHTELFYDEEVVTIILDNIISNALKYTKEGSVQIRYSNVVEEGEEYLKIEVKDSGVGIPSDLLDKIYTQYYQVGGKHKASGTGIGLALVKKLVELHQGTISVVSEVNKGTSFYFRIGMETNYLEALYDDSNDIPKTKRDSTLDKSKPIVLIVEDNVEMQNYIAQSLNDNYLVIIADNGNKGVKLAQEKVPDVIISDIMMPIMDGIDLCRILKEDMRTSHIPIILLTAKDTIESKTEGYEVGADSYITKPFNASLLRTRIENILETREKIADFVDTKAYKKLVIEESTSELDNEFIKKAVDIINENISDKDLTVSSLAEEMFMSNSTFYRKIKAVTNLSGSEFLRHVKMKHAEELMLSRKYSITEVSYMVGCSSLTQFRRLFRAEFNMSPSEYIEQIKND